MLDTIFTVASVRGSEAYLPHKRAWIVTANGNIMPKNITSMACELRSEIIHQGRASRMSGPQNCPINTQAAKTKFLIIPDLLIICSRGGNGC